MSTSPTPPPYRPGSSSRVFRRWVSATVCRPWRTSWAAGWSQAPVASTGHALLHRNDGDSPLFDSLPSSFTVWMSHGDQVLELPPGFRPLAHTDNSPVAVMGNDDGVLGLQFHPEVVHTPDGKRIIENFLYRVCGCQGAWTPSNFVEESVARIRGQVGDGKVICALSGGVDSTVTAALVHRRRLANN